MSKKTLLEKITEMKKEVGLLPMVCIESECKARRFYNIRDTHCPEVVPHVFRIGDYIRTVDLCTQKIEDYFKK